jgi:hypothetical protein
VRYEGLRILGIEAKVTDPIERETNWFDHIRDILLIMSDVNIALIWRTLRNYRDFCD